VVTRDVNAIAFPLAFSPATTSTAVTSRAPFRETYRRDAPDISDLLGGNGLRPDDAQAFSGCHQVTDGINYPVRVWDSQRDVPDVRETPQINGSRLQRSSSSGRRGRSLPVGCRRHQLWIGSELWRRWISRLELLRLDPPAFGFHADAQPVMVVATIYIVPAFDGGQGWAAPRRCPMTPVYLRQLMIGRKRPVDDRVHAPGAWL
jgi:hypothetical protein